MSMHIHGIKAFDEDPFEIAKETRSILFPLFSEKMDRLVEHVKSFTSPELSYEVPTESARPTTMDLSGDAVFDAFRLMELSKRLSFWDDRFIIGYDVSLFPAYNEGVLLEVHGSREYHDALVGEVGRDYPYQNQADPECSEIEQAEREEAYKLVLEDKVEEYELTLSNPTYLQYSTYKTHAQWERAGLL